MYQRYKKIMEEEKLEMASQPEMAPLPPQILSHENISSVESPHQQTPNFVSINIEEEAETDSRWTNEDFLDALDNENKVNVFFVFAVLIGVSLASLGQQSLQTKVKCDARPNVTMDVVEFGAIAFGIFSFSTLFIYVIKDAVKHMKTPNSAQLKRRVLKWGLVFVSCVTKASIGCLFYSISNVIQVRLGMVSCGAKATIIIFGVMNTFIAAGVVCSLCQTAYFAWAV